MSDTNTFGDYEFESWIPERTREMIRNFWGCFGRTHQDWLEDHKVHGSRLFCHHGPNPNGFGMPPSGATADYFIRDYALSKEVGFDVYRIVRGRYVHRWNNMGSLIDTNGVDHTVSTCDRWVRIFTHEAERFQETATIN